MWLLEAQPLGSTNEGARALQTLRQYLISGTHIVGRNQAAGISIEDDKSISRQHALVYVDYRADSSFRVKGTGDSLV